MSRIVKCMVVCGVVAAAGCATSFKGKTVVSPRFRDDANRVAVMYEATGTGSTQLWFLSQLHQALMKQGYVVTERLHYPRVLHDLMLQENAQRMESAASTVAAVGQKIGFSDNYGFVPPEIKQIGSRYAVDYLAVYTQWPAQQACLRLVDCQTAEVVATSIFRVPQLTKGSAAADIVADLFVMSLDYASRQRDTDGKPMPVYLDVSPSMKSAGGLTGVKRILYQEKVRGSKSAMYAVIYTM